ncbi:putative Late nodulin [Medicago truncatula]|uniref:Late nodulin n=1 Tax=Medicago truncatula TaxID=3880 RepID=G7LG05_MEDTR|nr:late nodulin [Medicago truncatula]RHN40278.1 putative Late nodulin [Medicago truncatula]
MSEIIKFVYAMFIFIFMFTVATETDALCDSNRDCRGYHCNWPKFPICVRMICECI